MGTWVVMRSGVLVAEEEEFVDENQQKDSHG